MPHAMPPWSAAARAPFPRRSLLTRASTGDTQTVLGRSGSVSRGGHCSFPLVLVHTRFCLHSPSVSGGSADGDFDHEIKRPLFLGRKAMTNLDSVFFFNLNLFTLIGG